jgi:type II secretory ATPase GspE/PulE/Tfp pilus assembly ATPase PilB-like protein
MQAFSQFNHIIPKVKNGHLNIVQKYVTRAVFLANLNIAEKQVPRKTTYQNILAKKKDSQ